MKKLPLALLALTLAAMLALSGCSKQEDSTVQPTPEPEAAATAQPTPEPTVTPAPTRVARVAPKDIEYTKLTSNPLNIAFDYPSHWLNEAGSSTICYYEPVNEGETGARMAISAKKMTKKPNTTKLKSEMNAMLEVLTGQYDTLTRRSRNVGTRMIKTAGISQYYRASVGDQEISGYLLMAYSKSQKSLYLFHFSSASSEFDSYKRVIEHIRNSCLIV